MNTAKEILNKLQSMADPADLEAMARFGLTGEKRLGGISIPTLRKMAKEIGKDHKLALDLWRSGIPEAMILASMIDRPQDVTEDQMEEWVVDFNAWDICDQVCNNLFEKSELARAKVFEWAERDEEFVKRTPFALIACFAWHDKQAKDESFLEFFPLIRKAADDERNFVKKAVNWALRNIGKRNLNLNKEAIKLAEELETLDSKSARWIAKDALRELRSEQIQERLKTKYLPKD